MDIKNLRQDIRRQRRALSDVQQSEAAQSLCRHLTSLTAVQAAKRIALYLANDGEIDPSVLLQWALQRGVACYLPVISSASKASGNAAMQFAAYDEHTTLKNNRFGIPEPVTDRAGLIEAGQLDVILMPLVAFDDSGNRIGMGGGFYDRTLAFKAQQTYDQPPKLIGLAHSFQQLDKIVPAAWDVPLDGIASELNAKLFTEEAD